MSLPELRGAGRLLTDPRSGDTKAGGTWTSALVKFQAWKKVDGEWTEGDTTVASVITFDDDAAAALRGHAKGDDIAVQGTVSAGMWQDKPQLKVTASKVWTPERKPRGQRGGQDRPNAGAAKQPSERPPGSARGTNPTRQQRTADQPPRQRNGIVTNLAEHVEARRRTAEGARP